MGESVDNSSFDAPDISREPITSNLLAPLLHQLADTTCLGLEGRGGEGEITQLKTIHQFLQTLLSPFVQILHYAVSHRNLIRLQLERRWSVIPASLL
jgi:hypothetical protein